MNTEIKMYYIEYCEMDKHWIAMKTTKLIDESMGSTVTSTEDRVVMRFPSREQAEAFVEKRINYIWDTENNSEKEGWLIFDKSL